MNRRPAARDRRHPAQGIWQKHLTRSARSRGEGQGRRHRSSTTNNCRHPCESRVTVRNRAESSAFLFVRSSSALYLPRCTFHEPTVTLFERIPAFAFIRSSSASYLPRRTCHVDQLEKPTSKAFHAEARRKRPRRRGNKGEGIKGTGSIPLLGVRVRPLSFRVVSSALYLSRTNCHAFEPSNPLRRLPVLVIRPLPILEQGIDRFAGRSRRVEPGIDVLGPKRDDAAVVSCGSDFLRRLVGDRRE